METAAKTGLFKAEGPDRCGQKEKSGLEVCRASGGVGTGAWGAAGQRQEARKEGSSEQKGDFGGIPWMEVVSFVRGTVELMRKHRSVLPNATQWGAARLLSTRSFCRPSTLSLNGGDFPPCL